MPTRHNTIDVVRSIPGWDCYGATKDGKIVSWKTGSQKYVNGSTSDSGYVRINLRKGGKLKSFYAHRLVFAAFFGDIPSGLQVHHVNGIKQDNHIDNLELVTRHENLSRAWRDGLIVPQFGEQSSGSKVSEIDVIAIRKLLKIGVAKAQIAKLFNLHRSSILRIHNKETWGWLNAD